MSRGVERKKDVAALSEKEESFVKEMNILSAEAEKNMYFFSSKINIPNENIQLNIQNIYKTFLDIAGRDYSKTELLNDKYYTLCSNSLKELIFTSFPLIGENVLPIFSYSREI